MKSFDDSRRGGDAFFVRGSALAAVLSCILLAGCSAGDTAYAPTTEPAAAVTPVPTPTASPSDDPADRGGAESAPAPTQSAALDEPIEFGTGMGVAVSGVAVTAVEAQTPGEVSGPAVVVTVSATNEGADAVDLSSSVVTLTTDDGAIGIPTTAGPGEPFSGAIAPGATAEARYVFMLDPATDRGITVTVNYSAGKPYAVFTGRTS